MLESVSILLALLLSAALCGADTTGTARLSFNGSPPAANIDVQAGSVGTWTLTYTAGPAGVAVGGGIEVWRVPAKFWLGQCLQSTDPKAPDYVTCQRTGQGSLELPFLAGFYKETYFARIIVKDKPLAPGESITVNFGDRSGGGPGAVVPPSTQYDMEFYVRADVNGSGNFEKLDKSIIVNCVPGPATRAVMTLPSVVQAGEKLSAHIRLEDANCNLCIGFVGSLNLSCSDPKAELPSTVTFSASDHGCKIVQITMPSTGVHYVSASGPGVHGCSNPCRCVPAKPERRVYWGDIHNHTEESDGTGTVDKTFLYARDVVALDFCSVSDHLHPTPNEIEIDPQSPHGKLGLDAWWRHQQEEVKRYDNPGKFAAILGYEWTEDTNLGGDHNVYHEDSDASLVCLPDLNDQYRALENRPGREIVIPHVGGRVANWAFHDSKLEPVLEISSMHGHFEWFAQEALARGYKLGFTGGSDGHLGLPGNDIWPQHGRAGLTRRDYGVPSAITAVCARDLTRKSILDAICQRRCYATTGVRILLDFSMDGNPMGAEYSAPHPPKLTISASGTAPIARVEVIRNDKRLFDRKTSGLSVDLALTDEHPVPGVAYYYIRVTQADGEMAWSSPIWLTYTGKQTADSRTLDAWNAEDSLPGKPSGGIDYTDSLLKHLAWRAPGRFSDVRQVGIVKNDRGSYALFYCRDKKWDNGPAHIRWYLGFPDERIRVDRGYRDFGVAPD
jgi:hypothetical protein